MKARLSTLHQRAFPAFGRTEEVPKDVLFCLQGRLNSNVTNCSINHSNHGFVFVDLISLFSTM